MLFVVLNNPGIMGVSKTLKIDEIPLLFGYNFRMQYIIFKLSGDIVESFTRSIHIVVLAFVAIGHVYHTVRPFVSSHNSIVLNSELFNYHSPVLDLQTKVIYMRLCTVFFC
jgi:hypothetical protein